MQPQKQLLLGNGELVVLAAACMVGMATNAAAVRRITATFDMSGKAVYFLILMDGVVSCMTSAAVVMSTGTMLLSGSRHIFLCAMPYMSLYPANTAGLLINAEIAIVRHYSLRLARQNSELPERTVRLTAAAAVVGFVTVHLSAGLLLESHGEVIFLAFRKCTGSGPFIFSPASIVLFGTPFHIFCTMSLIADVLILRSLRKTFAAVDSEDTATTTANSNNNVEENFDVPVRATVLSAMTILAHVMVTACLNAFGVDVFTKISAVNLTASVMLAIRCPLATILTFAQKKKVEKKETRQKMQEREREHAKRERVEKEARCQQGLGPHDESRPKLPEHIRGKIFRRQAAHGQEVIV